MDCICSELEKFYGELCIVCRIVRFGKKEKSED